MPLRLPERRHRTHPSPFFGLTFGHLRGIREEFVQSGRLLIHAFGDATSDEFGDLRDAADMRTGDKLCEGELTDTGPHEEREVMVRGVLVVAQEMLGHERTHGDGEMRKRRSEGEAHALAAGFARELQERGFLGVAGRDEAGVVRELGQ